jgi:quercetin dioxygenase-like cupin family protein
VLVRAGETAGRLGVVRVRASPGEVLRPHRHVREDEIAVVLDGTLEVRTGAAPPRTVGPDGSVVLPAGDPHTMVAGPAGVDLLLCFLPGGLEDLLELLRERPRSTVEDDDAAALLTAAGVGLLPRRGGRPGAAGG